MVSKLTNMHIDRVDLVDKGANGRRFAILKRDGQATFAQLQARDDVGEWLTPALDDLAEVVWAALYPPSTSGDEPEATVEERLTAVANSVDEFREALVLRLGEAIGKRAPARARHSDRAAAWAGFL